MFVHIVVYTTMQIATALLCDFGLSVLISCPLWTDAHCARQIGKASNDLNAAALVFICIILGKESYSMLVMLSVLHFAVAAFMVYHNFTFSTSK